MPHYLFGSSGQPRVEDVDQGQRIGDCWLLASLGAIVRTADGRRLIRRHARHLVGPVYEIDLWSHPDLTRRAQGWETYRINASRLHDQATPRPIRSAGGRGHGEAIEPCREYYELYLVGDGEHRNALTRAPTGQQLIKEILSIRPNMRIILCTGFSEKISEEKAGEPGINALVFKPFVTRDFTLTVRKVLDK